MAFFSDLEAHVEALRSLIGADPDAGSVPALAAVLDDDAVVAVIAEASAVVRAAESLRVAASGVVAARSSRQAGHAGLAQVRGHRSPVALVQEITGSTRTDAVKQVRLGQALLAQVPAPAGAGEEDATAAVIAPVWHAPLGVALLAGRITVGQHDAILHGLGDPPTIDLDGVPGADADHAGVVLAAAREQARLAWETAAVQLIGEAGCRTVEELAGQARAIRDILDPDGAARRFQERFERRSFRIWTDPDGVTHGSFLFDDEAALWVRTVLDAALAPRRGVRFVDPGQQARADQLATDPRSTDQLAHDLLIDLLRAGALTDAETVFATRQAGVRIIMTQQAVTATAQGGAAVAGVLDDCTTLPGWAATRHACDTGTSRCLLDGDGNPLDLGREARLFTPKQKLTLAIRDGGCRWPGCDRPAHYCEAHHIDTWATGGTTDIDRGILLCRFHHTHLHHGRWRITRDGKRDFVLHPPGGAPPIVLTTRLARQYLWRTTPPPPRFRLAAA